MTGVSARDRFRGEWSVAAPAHQVPVPGVRLIGFRERTSLIFDELILPSPTVKIVLDCDGGSLRANSVGAAALVSGVAPTHERVRGSHIDCLELQLSPLMVPALLDVHPGALSHAIVALDDIWGRDAERLVSQLRHAQSWEQRFLLVNDLLIRRHRGHLRPDAEVADAWRRIIRSGGQVSVTALSQRSGWSRTRLWRRFTHQLGISPKYAMRITRFDHALRRISSGDDLAAVAAACGYADQSHMHRDFHEFAAATPGSFRGDPLWNDLG